MNIIITSHARQRMKQYLITTDDIKNCLINGTREESQGNYKYIYDIFEVITNVHDNENTIIITVHYNHIFNKQCEKISKQFKISFRDAIKVNREQQGL